jgi:hypothetical protein
MLDSPTEARHLKMKIGRVTKHWNRNCLAVGLSQGFIEPLEATALLFIQRTVSTFVEVFEAGDFGEKAREAFNEKLNVHFEGTRDYIVTHYKTNSRTDTEYWKANAANPDISEALKQLYATWMSGRSLVPDIGRQAIGRGYPVCSCTASWPDGDLPRGREASARERRARHRDGGDRQPARPQRPQLPRPAGAPGRDPAAGDGAFPAGVLLVRPR